MAPSICPRKKWREVIGINLDSYYLLAHAVLPGMVARRAAP